MRVASYPNCCGAIVLNDFGNTPTSGQRTDDVSIEQLEEEWEQEYESINSYQRKGIATVIINSDQVQAGVGQFLVSKNFMPVVTHHYHGHGRDLTLYVKVDPEVDDV